MINRRNLLKMLSSIPLVGLMVPKAQAESPSDRPKLAMSFTMRRVELPVVFESNLTDADLIEVRPLENGFAEVRLYGESVSIGIENRVEIVTCPAVKVDLHDTEQVINTFESKFIAGWQSEH